MQFSLSPYNYYILYASIALLVLFLILTAVKALKAVKEIKAATDPYTTSLNRNLKLMNIKTEVMAEKRAEDAKKNKYIKLAIPILLAIQKVYQNNDAMVGPKGYVQAAQKYFKDQKSEKDMIAKIKKAL
ncbi:MAG: hypothetical protein K6G61_05205 [Solobacterium sp.]|nr:hypothetical protein [Solobacterium sp.]